MSILDLRSDTLTKPSAEMREAILNAEVGDDVFGEDPTVTALERHASDLLGTEAALFVPSGTMGNQIAMLTHCNRGDDVLVGKHSHSMLYEAGGGAALAGVQFSVVGETGHYSATEAESAISVTDPGNHMPNTTLLMVENTHNSGGGLVMRPEAFADIVAVARRHNVKVHIDGARIFNAAAALSCGVDAWTAHADSTSFCLSKGLGAPVGSLLCGRQSFISKAHRFRKMLGGGMRQAGLLAAAGLYALTHQTEQLSIDNARARAFAEGLTGLQNVTIDPSLVQSNIVIFHIKKGSAESVCECLAPDMLVLPMGKGRVRAVFHRDLPSDVVERALELMKLRVG